MDYKDTLNLPQTKFAMKANLPENEPKKLVFWDENQIYEKLVKQNSGKNPFLFHDGPPYANGDIHYGHILNKVLKDIVLKYKNMSGNETKIIMGWDCHGLPIELQVDKKIGKAKRDMSKAEILKECRLYATEQISNQKEQFKRLGVFSNWDYRYHTMDFSYEAQIIREFGKIAEKKVLYKGKKPVHWCPSCVTALAEAEIEYDDHTSFSVYVTFKLNYSFPELDGRDVYIVIWTTTPWTLPANLGISLHPDYEYVVIESKGKLLVFAKDLLESVGKDIDLGDYKILHQFKGKELDRETCDHPFIDRKSLIMNGTHVTLEAGTGCVHTAPGHGMDDYIIGLQYGLDVFNPVDQYGKYTEDFPEMQGVSIKEANKLIEDKMAEMGVLLNEKGKRVKHSYPHCWRCSNPIIFRATEQWFIPMDSEFALREKALKEIKKVEWIPKWGEDRINGMIENRPDWCISRQRLWGIPIPVFYCQECGLEVVEPKFISKVADAFENEGIEAWHNHEASFFMEDGYKCSKCGSKEFRKESDILDVWFDSGVSYAAVMEKMQGVELPVDLYLEGSDQHRGWFHSSLLTSVITRDKAPYKKVLTHGFVMADDGKKLSKKLKNFEAPAVFINKNGVEILRLWVASEDYRNDTRFGPTIITRIQESYRKFRNTARYALSNLYDFNLESNDVELTPYSELHFLDRWTLSKLSLFTDRVLKAYENYEFHMIYYYLNELCAADLSAFYFSIIKDPLYADRVDGARRRSIQTVLFYIVDTLSRVLAPILSFTAEEIYGETPNYKDKKESVFLAGFPEIHKDWIDNNLMKQIDSFSEIRDAIQKELEKARRDKIIGQNLDAKVELFSNSKYDFSVFNETGSVYRDFDFEIASYFIVSQFKVVDSKGDDFVETDVKDLFVKVGKADGGKCERCWTYSTKLGTLENHPDLCPRCSEVIE